MSLLAFFNDSQSITDLPPNIADEVVQRNLVSIGDSFNVSFCGLLVRGRDLIVFLPKTVDLTSLTNEEKVKVSSELMRAVSMYGEASKTRVNLSDSYEGIEGDSQLDLIISLLRNYQEMGLYTRRRSSKALNTGKPNWNKTISTGLSFPNAKSIPVYLDVISSKSDFFNDSEVARIQAHIIREVDEKYSWILTGKVDRIAPELADVLQPRGDHQYMISKLKRELPLLYSNKEIYLIKLLIDYLENVSGSADSKMTIGLTKFHFAWEYMLSRVLEDVWSGINRLLPVPTYRSSQGEYIRAFRNKMKTDIALRRNYHDVVIVDAKYYEATNINNTPSWSDIVKQFFYEKSLLAVNDTYKIKNAFIFPGNKRSFFSIHLGSQEKADIVYNEKFSPINCYYISPEDVISHFVNYKKMSKFTDLLFEY
ncbi:LlaJI family restriction endonuclease [Bermanella sp. R86510]|uniref:LlaJI family restriction endonuclease n=1 Tax=unclassified Bermanella TaxID=2627862 RepID=UPI0037C76A90